MKITTCPATKNGLHDYQEMKQIHAVPGTRAYQRNKVYECRFCGQQLEKERPATKQMQVR